jgi:hypothetical protein
MRRMLEKIKVLFGEKLGEMGIKSKDVLDKMEKRIISLDDYISESTIDKSLKEVGKTSMAGFSSLSADQVPLPYATQWLFSADHLPAHVLLSLNVPA